MKDPLNWPINRDTHSIDIELSDTFVNAMSDAIDDYTPLDDVLSDEVEQDALELVLVLSVEYMLSGSISVQYSDLQTAPERYIWCAIAGRDQVLRIDVSKCKFVCDMRNKLVSEGRLGIRNSLAQMWKVRILWYTHRLFLINLQISAPDNWSVESIVTGRLRVPRTEVDLQEISVELYGSSDMDEELGGELDNDKVHVIMKILNERSSSWSSSSSSSDSTQSDPLAERDDIRQALKELGFVEDIFQHLDVCFSFLICDLNLKRIYFKRNHVGDVFTLEGEHYIIKYLRPGRCDEIKVLRYLSKFDSTHNHAPSDIIVHELREGALLLTRYLGTAVRNYAHLSEDLLLIVQQIFEGVAFLHSKHVVHMDLKLSHILVDDSKRVWIIDYDLSEILTSAEEKVSGYRGTKGCTAPEVGPKAYNPIAADGWATGKVVKELCDLCPLHKDRIFLEILCAKLMDGKTEERSTAKEAYKQLTEYIELTKPLSH